jgi:hypothetical protein
VNPALPTTKSSSPTGEGLLKFMEELKLASNSEINFKSQPFEHSEKGAFG